jgi:hypothetical protein
MPQNNVNEAGLLCARRWGGGWGAGAQASGVQHRGQRHGAVPLHQQLPEHRGLIHAPLIIAGLLHLQRVLSTLQSPREPSISFCFTKLSFLTSVQCLALKKCLHGVSYLCLKDFFFFFKFYINVTQTLDLKCLSKCV